MTDTKHPLPWRKEPYTNGDINYLNIIADDGSVVCSTWEAAEAPGLDAVYELIVQAVNSHERLARSVIRLLEIVERDKPKAHFELESRIGAVRRALALAEPIESAN